MLSTFSLTVLLDLTIALQVGLVIASIAFLRSMSNSSNVTAISQSWDDANGLDDVSNFSLSPMSGAQPAVMKAMEDSGLLDQIG